MRFNHKPPAVMPKGYIYRHPDGMMLMCKGHYMLMCRDVQFKAGQIHEATSILPLYMDEN